MEVAGRVRIPDTRIPAVALPSPSHIPVGGRTRFPGETGQGLPQNNTGAQQERWGPESQGARDEGHGSEAQGRQDETRTVDSGRK